MEVHVTAPLIDIFDPAHRFVPTVCLREAYLPFNESRSPGAPLSVMLQDGLELGIVQSGAPLVARAISSLLTRSLEEARCEQGGHLPTEVVRRVQSTIISVEGVEKIWGKEGHRFVLARRVDADTHEIVATILVGKSKDTIFFFTGRYNNLQYSKIATAVDFNQPDDKDPTQRWFDRFAFPPIQYFKPNRYHHIANFVVAPENRQRGIAKFFLDSIVRYYSRDVLDGHNLEIVHSQFLLCGIGFWQIGDPPWLARMEKLGFYRRWGAESFFIERNWAKLPSTVMNGQVIGNVAYNRMYDMPTCYSVGQIPYPSGEHLFERIAEVMRLAECDDAKLQYYQAMYDFLSAYSQGAQQ